jgi:hypothetical protein
MTHQLNLTSIQTRKHVPTAFENRLGDAIEDAFARGIHDLEPLVAAINEFGSAAPDAQPWTTETFTSTLKRLAEPE